jgi:hypothetical protein
VVARRKSEPVIDESDIETELASVARVELRGFQFDDHVAQLLDMKEQQVEVVVVTVDLEVGPRTPPTLQ